jgi:hypothetical protein
MRAQFFSRLVKISVAWSETMLSLPAAMMSAGTLMPLVKARLSISAMDFIAAAIQPMVGEPSASSGARFSTS